ncbi:hypothetical protein DES53_10238 [Roseimicrobium gellanilyticum]|uniref:Uncharacterized protein n=1 Tax=Roseimicrobium gellanilyticum TaxID=748857 RepID=A0A366HQ82_9BACT|nr:hypothetical protein DES53_10238 [Roseimicrobium gellanilyticum]
MMDSMPPKSQQHQQHPFPFLCQGHALSPLFRRKAYAFVRSITSSMPVPDWTVTLNLKR